MSDIIKFLWATVVLLGGFLYNAENIGEQESQEYFKDYLNKQEILSEQTVDSWSYHQSASTVTYQEICKTAKICAKTDFVGNFLDQEKTKYIQDTNNITNFIDQNNVISPSFTDKLKTLKINNEEWSIRWYATWDTVVLNVWDLEDPYEYSQLSTHELGHIFDLGFLQWNSKQKNPNFTEFKKTVFANNDPSLLYYAISWNWENVRKAWAKQKNFCSWYGMSNPFEDFAECYNLYINHNAMFKNIATKDPKLAKKYNFMATVLEWKYLNKATTNLALVKDNQNRRPRDTTKVLIQ